jgi:rhodanese-related sulfurtransferase
MIRQITRQQIELKRAEHERVVLIEAQAGGTYERAHLPGAEPMPVTEVARLARQYIPDPGAQVVIYGDNALSREPDEVAERLALQGYGNLYLYRGGKQDWFASGEYRDSVHEPPAYGTHVEFAGEPRDRAPRGADDDNENTASAFDHASAAE